MEQIDCNGDSIKFAYSASEAVAIKLSADGAAITVIEDEFDAEVGHGRLTAYPLLKTQEKLTIEVRGASDPVVVALP